MLALISDFELQNDNPFIYLPNINLLCKFSFNWNNILQYQQNFSVFISSLHIKAFTKNKKRDFFPWPET